MNRATINDRAIAFLERFIGMNYSQPYRLKIHDGGYSDCSSAVAAACSYAGYPLLTASKGQLTVSNTEVYATGHDLIYPSTYAGIGKVLPSPSSVVGLMERGDLVFYNFDSKTTRANKITHVGMVRDAKRLIQTANNTIKLSGAYSITWGSTRVCAIIRLKDNVESLALPDLRRGSGPAYAVRVLQAILNHGGEKLTWEGNFGPLTEAALKRRQSKEGRDATGVCDDDEWAALFGEAQSVPTEVDMLIRSDPRKTAVAQWQRILVLLGYDLGTYKSIIDGKPDGSDGDYGSKTVVGTTKAQTDLKVVTTHTGMADDVTILAAAWKLSQTTGSTAEVDALKAAIVAAKAALGQIATIADAHK